VAKAWRDYRVLPWRSQTFKFSTDAELEAKVHDIVALDVDLNRPGLVEAFTPWRMGVKAAPRSTGTCVSARLGWPSGEAGPGDKAAAIKWVADQLGIGNWDLAAAATS